jgi:hypothetical protein
MVVVVPYDGGLLLSDCVIAVLLTDRTICSVLSQREGFFYNLAGFMVNTESLGFHCSLLCTTFCHIFSFSIQNSGTR